MKIKLSKSQWEMMGKKSGWMKQAQYNFDHRDPKNYMPGQTPYTDEEWGQAKKMIGDAANAEETMSESELEKEPELRDDLVSRRRSVKVTFSNGDTLVTSANGTKQEIRKYFLPYGNRGESHDYDMNKPNEVRHVVDIKFLD